MVNSLNESHPENIQFLVRIHRRDDVGRYAAIAGSNVKFQVPGAPIAHLDDQRLMEQSDLRLLRDTLAYTDVLVNTASTISIDAAALDKPVVNIKFDLHKTDYIHSVRRYFDMVHYKPFVGSQATCLATSFDEMLTMIERYLDNSEFEHEQRYQLAKTMCYKVDGKSAERISSYLLDALYGKPIPKEVAAAGP
jgi:CDP-glycerol glycerophosphotransferase (TagB/SpsB family)